MIQHQYFLGKRLGERIRETVKLGYQCVALVKEYSETVHGVTLGVFMGSAYMGWITGSPFIGRRFKRVYNTLNAIPPQGAIIFFKRGIWGHVAIVHEATLLEVTVIEQNGGKGSNTGLGNDAIRLHTYDYINPKCLGWYEKI